MNRKEWTIFSLLLIVIFILEVFVVHRFLTTQVPGASDFYSRWHGARALLLEGRNPYSLDVTEEIQPVIGIDPLQVGRGGFNYPLHVIFFFWPLVYIPYDWTQAIWWTVVLWLAFGTTLTLLNWVSVKPRVGKLLAIILATLSFYPIVRSVFLGQFTIHVLFFLALTLAALKRKNDVWAGIFLSAASIKPQMVIFIAPWLILWAVSQKRWRFLHGLLGGGLAFLLSSMILMPRWPLAFLEDLQRYRQFSGGYTPIQLLIGYLWPKAPELIWQILSAVLIVFMLHSWWENWKNRSDAAFRRALSWTIVAQILVTFQTGTTNQVLLLIPWLVWSTSAQQTRWKIHPALATALVWILTWILFLVTVQKNNENPIMFLPLPILALFILAIQSLYRRHNKTIPATA